jgi:predicted LPLAT superfamily acyltransferase
MSASSLTPAETARWTQIAERGSLLGLRFSVWCYRTFGRGFATVLAHGIVGYFFLTDRAGRRASAAYLRRVLGRAPRFGESFLHYRAFALAIVDRVALWLGQGDEFRFETHGMELFDRLSEQGRGCIILGAHLGSFDALRLLAERQRTVVNVLMFTAHARRINAVLRELSPEVEARVIQVTPGSVQAIFEVRRCLARGEHVAMLADRVEPADRGRTGCVPLLGGRVALPQAPFLMAHLMGCPVALMLGLRRGPAHYEVFAEEIADRVKLPRDDREPELQRLLARYASRLEHYCRRTPFQWFNFFDYWHDAETAS